ncbi:GTP cyclohydrolase II [Methylomonas sp. LW13]|uniref:GTP cyclohydrolase II n=1 Tax=unclassified Methylomonas TaxID=2608980 RepID=UPI0009FFA1DD|nr:GTP cyclohydrolase II [Methylomonas sp. LW13]QBC29897.1 GTP cyclohydrolase II [Methylomonas sp. LW13]
MSKSTVSRLASTRIPTAYGDFQLCYYSNTLDNKEHLAFVMGSVSDADNVLVRIHSECFTGDVLGSRRCDCGEQLDRSLQLIASQGAGVLVYLRQEGRGIGLLQKMRAYNLQDQGYDTVDANLLLGHGADERDYSLAVRILEELGVKSIRLMTNNPLKIQALESEGMLVKARIPLEAAVNADNQGYLLTKVRRMDHLLWVKPAAIRVSERAAHACEPAD